MVLAPFDGIVVPGRRPPRIPQRVRDGSRPSHHPRRPQRRPLRLVGDPPARLRHGRRLSGTGTMTPGNGQTHARCRPGAERGRVPPRGARESQGVSSGPVPSRAPSARPHPVEDPAGDRRADRFVQRHVDLVRRPARKRAALASGPVRSAPEQVDGEPRAPPRGAARRLALRHRHPKPPGSPTPRRTHSFARRTSVVWSTSSTTSGKSCSPTTMPPASGSRERSGQR